VQVFGVHGVPQMPFVLHTWPVVQSPQWIVLPVHALVMSPHCLPCAMHSSGVAFGSQRFAMPRTPQLSPALQPKPATVSQFTVPPQPSVMIPHSTPVFALAAAQSVAAEGAVHFGSQTWKTPLHVRGAPPSGSFAQPPQSV
jgi:hypothetical protein